MNVIYLSLGSNISPELDNLKTAINSIKNIGNIKKIAISSFYKTSPLCYENQPNFYNCAIKLYSELKPGELLNIISDIEKSMGRKREIKWGPRSIDIDIILFGDLIISTNNLTIPHPEMLNRKFVIEPLLELSPDLKHPCYKKKISELIDFEKLKNQVIEKIVENK